MVSLDSTLNSSDIVEIITRKDGAPKRKWLTFVKTTMARKHIKAYLNAQKGTEIAVREIPKKLR